MMANYIILYINILNNQYHSPLSTLTMSVLNWQEGVPGYRNTGVTSYRRATSLLVTSGRSLVFSRYSFFTPLSTIF